MRGGEPPLEPRAGPSNAGPRERGDPAERAAPRNDNFTTPFLEGFWDLGLVGNGIMEKLKMGGFREATTDFKAPWQCI